MGVTAMGTGFPFGVMKTFRSEMVTIVEQRCEFIKCH